MEDDLIVGFPVYHVAVEELADVDTFIVGLAETEVGDGPSLLLSIVLLPSDEQDHALGLDTYCVSTGGGATVYGGLTRCVLQDDALTLGFTPVAAKTLGLPLQMRLPLHVKHETIARLRDGLRRIFSPPSRSPTNLIL